MTVDDLTNFNEFKLTLGYSEGGGNYKAVYPKGATADSAKALGKYQFIPARIIAVSNYLNVDIPSNSDFLNDSNLQDVYFIGHCNLMLNEIENNGFMDDIGKTVTGANKYPVTVPVNIYGLMGGLHLGGVGGVRNYFKTPSYDAPDSLGTHVSDYLAKFSDKVSFVEKVIKTVNETVSNVINNAGDSPVINGVAVIVGIAIFYFVFKAR
jgi:hypothetical protein